MMLRRYIDSSGQHLSASFETCKCEHKSRILFGMKKDLETKTQLAK